MSYFKKITGGNPGKAGSAILATNPAIAGIMGAGAALSKSGLDKKIAENVGLGQFKPKDVQVDPTAFKDMSRSQAQMDDLEKQRQAASSRQFKAIDPAALGSARTMQSSRLGPTSQMRASRLDPARTISAATIDPSQQAEFRAQQQDLVAALQAQAAGEGPSLAQMQMDEAREQNIAQAMALAASQRGLGAGQGLRQISDQAQLATQQAARDAVRGRLQEQMAAQGQLGNVLAGARGQDIGLAAEQAGLAQQAGLSNQAAQNQFALQQAAMQQDAAARNQAAMNQFVLAQGAMDQQAAAANMAAGNQFTLQRAGMAQQTALANQAAQLRQQAQQDALMQALTAQMGQERERQDMMGMDLARLQANAQAGLQDLAARGYASRQNAITGLLGGLAGAGATIATQKPRTA